MTEKDAQFTLNGANYKLAIVLQNARFCPEIVLSGADLNTASDAETTVQHTDGEAANTSIHIVVFKQKGKYTVLAGQNKVTLALMENKQFKVRLMSSVALKKAKIHDEPQAPLGDSATTNRSQLRPEFANRRDPDNSYSRYSYARGRRNYG